MNTLSKSKLLSVILPLFDLRNCNWGALASVLRQDAPRSHFEVIAIVGHSSTSNYLISKRIKHLLDQCDQVVQTHLDPNDPKDEIHFYLSGIEKSTCDFLYFLEGHTALAPDALRNIIDSIKNHPNQKIFWGSRKDIASTPLGNLIQTNTARHVVRAKTEGFFSFGGTNVIHRDLMFQLGGITPDYGRFNEVILRHRLKKSGTATVRIPKILCYHYNDMPKDHLIKISRTMGANRYMAYSEAKRNPQSDLPLPRHFIFNWLQFGPWGRFFSPFFTVLAKALLGLAQVIPGLFRPTAFVCFLIGIACADLSGFCEQNFRIKQKSPARDTYERLKQTPF